MDKAGWEKIRLEYVTGDLSMRELAEKWGVNASTLMHHSKSEKWRIDRDKHRQKTRAKVTQKIADKQAAQAAKDATAIHDSSCDLLSAIMAALKRYEDGIPALDALSYARAIKALKETLGVETVKEAQESDARIAKLRKEAEDGSSDGAEQFNIKISGFDESWTK